MGGASVEPEKTEPDAASTLEEVAAAALEREDLAPAVRAEKVARARDLVADPNYPSKEILQSVAGLLADRLGAEDSR